jgi:hypothetical protein
MTSAVSIPMVRLFPKKWVPDFQVTGGNLPPSTLYISHTDWQFLEEPQSIEDYYAKLADLKARPLISTVNFRGLPVPQ